MLLLGKHVLDTRADSARLSEDDKDLEHQHWVEGWPPAFRPVRVAERRIQFRPKKLEIHRQPERFKLIAQIA
jgi:hypothetical protein